MLRNYNLVSLGFNCSVKKLLAERMCIVRETELFDYVGTPVWAINLILTGDCDLFDTEQYCKYRVRTTDHNDIVIHRSTYLRFIHDLREPEEAKNPKFLQKMERRLTRFKARIIEGTVFIRLEECMKDRNIEGFEERYQRSEYEELRQFSEHIRSRISKYMIIYINSTVEGYQNGIFSIKVPDLHLWNWDNCLDHYHRIFSEIELPSI